MKCCVFIHFFDSLRYLSKYLPLGKLFNISTRAYILNKRVNRGNIFLFESRGFGDLET